MRIASKNVLLAPACGIADANFDERPAAISTCPPRAAEPGGETAFATSTPRSRHCPDRARPDPEYRVLP